MRIDTNIDAPLPTPLLTPPPWRADADGDSTMNSSPELDAEDEMFPDEGPSTPRNAASFALDPTSELSPPNSQSGPSTLTRNDSTAFTNSPSMVNANGKRTRIEGAPGTGSGSAGAEAGARHTDNATGYQWSKQEDQPGYEWKNTRAKEDELRALDQIVDKSSQIKTRYGDPLKPSVPMTLKR
ncbi:hypothetical protein K458DRAFT_288676 [Lentithecium fluviatile CBS 122367]|uniref:Uncharacterized protein n=1 Tax=Lentithecium fluviatile CBS 122367 TaxID=1168545 RepID=A0A6G1JL13_9PLEO|nr:hypothetical protein K458DRAFT_288676 [Lentithecium fluviatile CBS 122367]